MSVTQISHNSVPDGALRSLIKAQISHMSIQERTTSQELGARRTRRRSHTTASCVVPYGAWSAVSSVQIAHISICAVQLPYGLWSSADQHTFNQAARLPPRRCCPGRRAHLIKIDKWDQYGTREARATARHGVSGTCCTVGIRAAIPPRICRILPLNSPSHSHSLGLARQVCSIAMDLQRRPPPRFEGARLSVGGEYWMRVHGLELVRTCVENV